MVTITPTPPVPATPPAQAAAPAAEAAPVQGDIVKLPQTLQNLDRSVTLQARVVDVAADGTAKLQTPRGTVEVKLPQPAPQPGQQVEVTIPAGAPPRTLAAQVPPQPAPQQSAPQTPPQQGGQPLPQTPLPQSGALPQQPGQPQTPVTQAPAQPQPGQPQSGQPQSGLPQAPVQNAPQPAGGLPPTAGNVPASLIGRIVESGLQNNGANMIANAGPAAFAGMRPGAPAAAGAMPLLQPGQMLRLTLLTGAQVANLTATPALQSMMAGPGSGLTATPGGAHNPAMPGGQQNIAVPQMGAPNPAGMTVMPDIGADAAIPGGEGRPVATPQTPGGSGATGGNIRPQLLAGMVAGNNATLAGNGTSVPQMPGAPQQGGTPMLAKSPMFMDVKMSFVGMDGGLEMPLGMDGRALTGGSAGQPFIIARMAGFTPQGMPVAQVPMQLAGHAPAMISYVMQVHGTMPPAGSWMAMEMLGAAGLDGADATGTWPTMTQALQGAAGGMPLAQMAVPQPTGGAAFTAPMLLLMNALQGGDMSGWLGDKGVGNLRTSGKAALLEKLGGEMRGSRAAASDQNDDTRAPQGGEWRSVNLPMLMDGSDIARLQLHWRDYGGDEGDDDAKKRGTRFLMDLTLSRMGDMQIDGLVADRQLDVILRAGRDLSPAMRESLRQRYALSLGAIGFTGELNFANKLLGTGEHPVPMSRRIA